MAAASTNATLENEEHSLNLRRTDMEANEEAGGVCRPSADQRRAGVDRYAAVFEQSPGASFQAVHGVNSDRYQQVFNQLVPQGFRPVVVSGYWVGGQDCYAAVFEQRNGSAFQARHGLTAAQYQQTFDQLVSQGFRPVVISGYSLGGQDRYAAVFEQRSGPAFQARHGLTSAQYQRTFDELVPQGFRPVALSGYSVGGLDRYAAVFEQKGGPPFQARHGLTAAQYQQTFDQLVPQGFRPVIVSGYSSGGQDRYAAVFEQRGGPAFQARHGLTSAQYQQTFDQLVPQGFRPVVVSGYSVG
jgi:polyglycine hydrolase-like protein